VNGFCVSQTIQHTTVGRTYCRGLLYNAESALLAKAEFLISSVYQNAKFY